MGGRSKGSEKPLYVNHHTGIYGLIVFIADASVNKCGSVRLINSEATMDMTKDVQVWFDSLDCSQQILAAYMPSLGLGKIKNIVWWSMGDKNVGALRNS